MSEKIKYLPPRGATERERDFAINRLVKAVNESGGDASDISYDDSNSGLSATDVQGAVEKVVEFAPVVLKHGGIPEPVTGLVSPLYIPTPGAREVWRCDASRTATPRTRTISGVSGTTITLSAAVAGPDGQFGRWPNMAGSKIRVWNTSKSPAQSAWVMGSPTTTTLTVTDAAHIASWSNGDTLRVGDPNPTGDNTLQLVAIDIGAHLEAEFGVVFPQKGVFLALYVSSSNGPAGLDFSPNGAVGTAVGGNALSNGSRNQTSLSLPTPVPSPISNSNLLFFREQLSGGATNISVALARMVGVYV